MDQRIQRQKETSNMKTRDPLIKLTLLLTVLLTLGAAQAQADILPRVSTGFSPVGITRDQTAFVQTYPPAIWTPQGQMRFGPLTVPARGASVQSEPLSFQIVDQLAH